MNNLIFISFLVCSSAALTHCAPMNNSSQKDINDQTPATARNEKSQPQKGSYLERLNNRNSPEEVENLAKQKNLPLIIKGIDGSGKKTGRL